MLWKLFAWIVSRAPVANWIIRRAQRTPYSHIMSRDGKLPYMNRWWLFNPYQKGPNEEVLPARWGWLPSIRVHQIVLADDDEHLHDHPWDARTIILRGGYVEEKRPAPHIQFFNCRMRGYTGPVRFNEFHRIDEVSPGGVYTLWFTWKYQGTWGFDVDGKKVPHREYLAGRARP